MHEQHDQQEFVLTDALYSSETFGLVVRGDSMLPEFRAGDILIIDPSVSARPGDFVVAADRNGQAVFKQFAYVRVNGSGMDVIELRSLNPLYPTWSSEITEFTIIGKMVELTRRYT